MTTGERIKQARKAAGMTQTELADKIGVKFAAIHKYENGLIVNLKRETIAALAAALNVSPAWLMCMDDEAEDKQPPTEEEVKFALFNGADVEITDEMYDEVLRFRDYVIAREKAKQKKE